jgi:hypothetical protein
MASLHRPYSQLPLRSSSSCISRHSSINHLNGYEIFYAKPPHIRKLLQEDITQLRYDVDEEIWLRVLGNFIRALREIVGVDAPGIVVTDLRFLIEMRGIKDMGGKIIHIKSADTNVPVGMRGHRSETELDSPEVKMLRDSYIFNRKNGIDELRHAGYWVLRDWGWA